jgi:hypothetical protein
MKRALDAYAILQTLDPRSPAFYHVALSMVVCYARPFTENFGAGSLLVEYPNFPDFPDEQLNVRHRRLWDLRNKFMSHSSCEGRKLMILPPGSEDPSTHILVDCLDHVVGEREFPDIRFFDWLKDVVFALKARLDEDVRTRLQEIAGHLSAPDEMDTGYDSFSWTVPRGT